MYSTQHAEVFLQFENTWRQRIFRRCLQCQINMNLVFHISEDGSEIALKHCASSKTSVKGAVSSFTHILFLYFLAILRISYTFSLIKEHKLHSVFKRQQMCGEITAIPTVTTRLDFCIRHALNTLYTK